MPDDLPQLPPPKEGLSVAFVTVEELFAGPYLFNLPWYQRAYAWTDDLAQRLFGDIRQAYADRAQRYFIGHILLSRRPGEIRHELIDGQQRSVTLMILFALLRHRLAGTPWAARMSALLEAGPDSSTNSLNSPDGPSYRLAPQPGIERFFRDTIQAPDAMLTPVDEFGASEVESNILGNRVRLDELLAEFEVETGSLASLAEFILTRCLMVLEVVESGPEDEAWRMLQTEENTGLPFHNCARAKVTLIEAMPAADRAAASRMWETCEAKLGNDGMQQLTSHIRDLSGRQRSNQPVEKDIVTRFKLGERGPIFMRDHLVPHAERLFALRQARVGTGASREHITRSLGHMRLAGHLGWCLPALRWLEKRGGDNRDTVEFFRLLSRKVWLLRLSGADGIEHERRFIALSNEIAEGLPLARIGELAAPDKMVAKIRHSLLSRTFFDKRYSRSLLRYLSDLMGSDSGEIDGQHVTVEHVLPRNPGAGSLWLREFGSSKNICEHAHRIGNLAFLSFQDNQRVGNGEWTEKRAVLRSSGFVLSVDAAAADHWTADHIAARSRRLVWHLFDHWQIRF